MTTTDPADYQPPIEGEPVYNLIEASALIGRSTGLFYAPNHRTRLEELGAKTGGRDWRIPLSALVGIGWLTEDLQPALPPITPRGTEKDYRKGYERLKQENEVLRIRAEIAEARVADKEAEIHRLQSTLTALIEKQ